MTIKKQTKTNFITGFDNIDDLFFFFKKNLMLLIIFLLVGAIFGFFYKSFSTTRYESIFEISMAKIPTAQQSKNLSDLSAIESGSQLILRMSSLKVYPPEIVAACELDDGVNNLNFNSILKMTLQKGSLDVVTFRVLGNTSLSALNCSNALFNYIKEHQNNQITDYINLSTKRLNDATFLLDDYINNVKKSSSKISPSVFELYILDEMRRLSLEIALERKYIDIINTHRTKLRSEFYVEPSAHSISLVGSIFFGSLMGLVFGLAISFFRRALLRNLVKLHASNGSINES